MITTNLFIPGAAKSGTSSLHDYLNKHPDICMSSKKEPQFFTYDQEYLKGIDYYNSIYNSQESCKYYGESSTSYLNNLTALERIKTNIPDAKFIVILRDPIERTVSHYKYLRSLGLESLPFKEAILKDEKTELDFQNHIEGRFKGYLSFSTYSRQIANLRRLFSDDQVYICKTERLKENPQEILHSIFEFLNLDTINIGEEIRVNSTNSQQLEYKNMGLYDKFKHLIPKSMKAKLKKKFNIVDLKRKLFLRPSHNQFVIEKDDYDFIKDKLRLELEFWKNL